MDELALIELTDAEERNAAGGGAMPLAMQNQAPMGALGQAGSQGGWYTNKTWLALMCVGVAMTGLTVYLAMRKKEE